MEITCRKTSRAQRPRAPKIISTNTSVKMTSQVIPDLICQGRPRLLRLVSSRARAQTLVRIDRSCRKAWISFINRNTSKTNKNQRWRATCNSRLTSITQPSSIKAHHSQMTKTKIKLQLLYHSRGIEARLCRTVSWQRRRAWGHPRPLRTATRILRSS